MRWSITTASHATPVPALADQEPRPPHRPGPHHPRVPAALRRCRCPHQPARRPVRDGPRRSRRRRAAGNGAGCRYSPSTCRASWTPRAREHVRSVEGDGTCRYLQRLAALHTSLSRPPPQRPLRCAAQAEVTGARSGTPPACSRPRTPAQPGRPHRPRTADGPARRPGRPEPEAHPAPRTAQPTRSAPGWRPLGPRPPGFEQTARPASRRTPSLSPLKGFQPMPRLSPITQAALRTSPCSSRRAVLPRTWRPGDRHHPGGCCLLCSTPGCGSPTGPRSTTASPKDAIRERSSRWPPSLTNWMAAPTGQPGPATGRASPPTCCSSSAKGSATPSASACPRSHVPWSAPGPGRPRARLRRRG